METASAPYSPTHAAVCTGVRPSTSPTAGLAPCCTSTSIPVALLLWFSCETDNRRAHTDTLLLLYLESSTQLQPCAAVSIQARCLLTAGLQFDGGHQHQRPHWPRQLPRPLLQHQTRSHNPQEHAVSHRHDKETWLLAVLCQAGQPPGPTTSPPQGARGCLQTQPWQQPASLQQRCSPMAMTRLRHPHRRQHAVRARSHCGVHRGRPPLVCRSPRHHHHPFRG